MKTIFYTIGFLILMPACMQNSQNNRKEEERSRVEALLGAYIHAIENKDYKTLENLWEEGDNTILLGTDSDERIMGRKNIGEAYSKQFELLSNTYIAVQDQYIRLNQSANTAWFSQRMNYNFMYDSVAHSFEGMRFTGVLIKDDHNNWKIVHAHLSVPAQINIGN